MNLPFKSKKIPNIHTKVVDLDAYWMPFTSNRLFKKEPRIITQAQGRYYTDSDGRKIFDGLSGLWTCGAGHCRREISEAVSQQIRTLDYSPSFNFSHPKVIELASRITELSPNDLNRVFFTNSGSESADTAIKIARAYWRQQGLSSKTKIIGRSKGYHGVNYGGISAGGIGANRALFGDGIDTDHLPHTLLPKNNFSHGLPENGKHLADNLLEMIALHDASNIAAVIVEPMAGSAGVIPPPKGYLQRLKHICDQHNILLIFDEVITAFGRIGSYFAAEEFGVVPDIITIAKQITNGTQPLGGVIVKEQIYQCFMKNAGPEHRIELPHGYTYSGHPVACAAALATLDILENDALLECSRNLAPIFEKALHSLKGLPYVTDIRNYGLAGGITIASAPGEPTLRPYQIAMSCWKKGFYVRNGGDTIQLGLPFTTTKDEVDLLINAIADSIRELT